MAIYKIKKFSSSQHLPSDWDEDDEAFIEKINKANKERQQKIDNFSPRFGAAISAPLGASLNAAIRDTSYLSRSSIIPSIIAGGIGYTATHLKNAKLKKKIDESNQIKSNYKKLKSKDKRLVYKNNYGNIQN